MDWKVVAMPMNVYEVHLRGATMVDYINTTPKLLINKQLSSNSEYESNNLILLLYHYYYCYYQEIKVS